MAVKCCFLFGWKVLRLLQSCSTMLLLKRFVPKQPLSSAFATVVVFLHLLQSQLLQLIRLKLLKLNLVRSMKLVRYRYACRGLKHLQMQSASWFYGWLSFWFCSWFRLRFSCWSCTKYCTSLFTRASLESSDAVATSDPVSSAFAVFL